MQDNENAVPTTSKRLPWNKGKLTGAKATAAAKARTFIRILRGILVLDVAVPVSVAVHGRSTQVVCTNLPRAAGFHICVDLSSVRNTRVCVHSAAHVVLPRFGGRLRVGTNHAAIRHSRHDQLARVRADAPAESTAT